MKSRRKVILLAVLITWGIVHKEMKAASEAALKEAERLSDAAWEKALPIVREDAKHGKHYVPRASRPAFPGAEGDGAYMAGGDERRWLYEY